MTKRRHNPVYESSRPFDALGSEPRPTVSEEALRDRDRRRELLRECDDPNVKLLGDPIPGRSALDQRQQQREHAES